MAVVEDEVVAEEDQEEAVEVVEEEVEVRCRHIHRVHLSVGQLFCRQRWVILQVYWNLLKDLKYTLNFFSWLYLVADWSSYMVFF